MSLVLVEYIRHIDRESNVVQQIMRDKYDNRAPQ